MEKTFTYTYKRYVYDITDYFEGKINAKNRKEAFIKIVAEHNGMTLDNAKKHIEKTLGKVWSVDNAIMRMNPLGSNDTALYRIDSLE